MGIRRWRAWSIFDYDSAILASLTILVLIGVVGGTRHWITGLGLIADAASLLLVSPQLMRWLIKSGGSVTPSAFRWPRLVARIVFAFSLAIVGIALGVIWVGNDKNWPAQLGYAGLAFSVLSLCFYLVAFSARRGSFATVRVMPWERKLLASWNAKVGDERTAALAIALFVAGALLQAAGARIGR
jgi:hypothetical protein